MHKKFILTGCTVVLLLISLSVGIVFFMFFRNIALPGQKLNGEDIGYSSVTEQLDAISHEVPKNFTITFGKLTMSLNLEDFAKLIDVRPTQSFQEWLRRKELTYKPHYTVNDKQLTKILKARKTKSSNAAIICTDGTWTLLPDEQATDYIIPDLRKMIESAIDSCVYSINGESCMIRAEVTTEMLQPQYEKVSWLNDFRITYDKDVALLGTELSQFIDTSSYEFGDMETVSEYLQNFAQSLNKQYATTGGSKEFKKHSGQTATIKYNTFGRQINIDKETAFLNDAVSSHLSQTEREPEMYGYDTFGDTYIEVSLSDQHVWHYVNGTICCESDCVTGRKNVHDTPTGIFYVSERIPGKYLIGEGYKTWVNKWMRLTNSGVGFHDATWRHSFGKQIYTYNGSHGCINLPYSYASKLYDEIERGIPVVIY